MPGKTDISRDDAQTIALNALTFLLRDPGRLSRFMALTGTSPETIRTNAAAPGFLKGILGYLSGDETLLLLFAESEGIDPGLVAAASRSLREA